MRHYLLVYGADEGRLLMPPREFLQAGEAYAALREVEDRYRGNRRVVVNLIGAASLDAVRVTHRNFFEHTSFEEIQSLTRDLAGLAASRAA